MIIDGRELSKNTDIEADICIMGGGVAGITLANELKDSFANIVLIEAGDEQYSVESQALYAANSKSATYPDPQHSRLRLLGGSSNHWGNNTSPLSKIDFEKREWIPNSGWPISLEDIQDYYTKAADYCGTSSDGYQTPYWTKRFNQPNLTRDSKNIEIGIAKAANPPTRFYASYGELISQHKNITIYKNTNVTDLEFDKQSRRVTSAKLNTYNEYKHTITAKIFVMCFGGIENARMLLHFNNQSENLLGNQFDNVGRYFMDHTTVRAAQLFTNKLEDFPLFEGQYLAQRYIKSFFQLTERCLAENQTTNLRIPLVKANQYELSDGISSFHLMKQALAKNSLPNNLSTHLSNFVMDFDLIVEALARTSFDSRLFDHANDFAGFTLPMMVEQTPHRNNQIKLSKVRDKLGIPKIDIIWEFKQEDKNRVWKSLEIFAREVGGLSIGRLKLLKEREKRIFGDQMGFGSHHMGTTRMSETEEQGVVDKNLQVFGTDNMYISGSSVFATGGHVPPTLTIAALSIRLADFLKKEKRSQQNG